MHSNVGYAHSLSGDLLHRKDNGRSHKSTDSKKREPEERKENEDRLRRLKNAKRD